MTGCRSVRSYVASMVCAQRSRPMSAGCESEQVQPAAKPAADRPAREEPPLGMERVVLYLSCRKPPYANANAKAVRTYRAPALPQ